MSLTNLFHDTSYSKTNLNFQIEIGSFLFLIQILFSSLFSVKEKNLTPWGVAFE